MRIQFALLSVAFSALSAVVTASPAQANCYENFGCTSEYFAVHQLEQASCQVLWEVRISSSRSAAIASHRKGGQGLRNAGCLYHDVARVHRNDFERANISVIKEVENSKGC